MRDEKGNFINGIYSFNKPRTPYRYFKVSKEKHFRVSDTVNSAKGKVNGDRINTSIISPRHWVLKIPKEFTS